MKGNVLLQGVKMECSKCQYYQEDHANNFCKLTGYKNYKIRENCELVQDDGFLTPEGKYYFDVWNVGKKEMEDIINHPNHYTNKAHECIDEMVAVFGVPAVIDYCKCCVWKYRYRADSKGHHEEDMKKADWYMSKIMELMETKNKSGAW